MSEKDSTQRRRATGKDFLHEIFVAAVPPGFKTSALSTQHFFLFLILLIAALLRFQYMLAIEHNVDHAYPVWEALRILDAGELPLTGQWTWLPVAHPALTGYLYVPFLGLTRSIVAVYVFVIALNTLAVYLTYRATTTLLGTTAGLVAAWLMAVNPWVIEYSRYSWPPALLPFFMSAVAWLLWGVLTGRARHPARRIFGTLVTLALLLQTTLIAWFALLQAGLLLLIFYRRIPRNGFVAGLAVLLITLGLYAAGLFAQRDRVQAQFDIFRNAATADAPQLKSDALLHAARLVTGRDYDLARGYHPPMAVEDVQRRQALSGSVFVPLAEFVLVMGVVAAGTCLLFPEFIPRFSPNIKTDMARHVPATRPLPVETRYSASASENQGVSVLQPRNGERNRILSSLRSGEGPGAGVFIILLLWFFLPVVLMSCNASLVHPYYLLVTLPAGFALAGWAVATIRALLPPLGAAIMVLLIPFGGLMGLNSARYYQETALTPGAEGLGALPVEWGLRLGEMIRAGLPENGIVFADVDEWTLNSFAARLFPVYRNLSSDAARLFPATGGLVIEAYSPGEAPPGPEFSNGETRLSLDDGAIITVNHVPPAAALALPMTDYPVSGETWLAFMGYTMKQHHADIALITYWRVMADPADLADFVFTPTAHVFKADGERALIADGRAIPAYQWHSGDILMQRLSFTLPEAGDYTVRVGQYDGVKQKGLIFILPDGTYADLIPLPEKISFRL